MNAEHPSIIRLNELDNVGVTLVDLASGDSIGVDNSTARVPVPAGHKVAIRSIKTQDPVIKFGQIIGFAASPIEPGDHVHTHNLEIRDFTRDYKIGEDARPTRLLPEAERASFEGIARADGQTATRNYIG
ncbi:MAG: UxaA family hydrolase, partial [Candidatus Neomarinimicrobiota bacterium]